MANAAPTATASPARMMAIISSSNPGIRNAAPPEAARRAQDRPGGRISERGRGSDAERLQAGRGMGAVVRTEGGRGGQRGQRRGDHHAADRRRRREDRDLQEARGFLFGGRRHAAFRRAGRPSLLAAGVRILRSGLARAGHEAETARHPRQGKDDRDRQGEAGGGASHPYITMKFDIMPMSSCSRLWQWSTYMPG